MSLIFDRDEELDRLRQTSGLSGLVSILLTSFVFRTVVGSSTGFAIGLTSSLLIRDRMPRSLLVAVLVAVLLGVAEVLGSLASIVSSMLIGVLEALFGDGELDRALLVLVGSGVSGVVTALAFAAPSTVLLANRVARVEWWFVGITIGLFGGELPVAVALAVEAEPIIVGMADGLMKPLIVAVASGLGMLLALRPQRSASAPTS